MAWSTKVLAIPLRSFAIDIPSIGANSKSIGGKKVWCQLCGGNFSYIVYVKFTFTCLLRVSTISLSRHEQVFLMRLSFKRYVSEASLITSSKTPVGIEVANMTIMSGEKVKLFGIHIDNRLNFDYHISPLCKKAGKKLHALTRVF